MKTWRRGPDRVRKASLLLLLVTAASLLVPATAVTPATASAKTSTYFRMAGVLQGTGTVDPTCNGFRYATTGALEGSPLGRVQWTGSECVDVVSSPGGFVISGEFSLNDGRLTLTGTYDGNAGLPNAAGEVYGWGTFSITGGSRGQRWTTGEGLFTVMARPAASTARVELIGALDRAVRRDSRKRA